MSGLRLFTARTLGALTNSRACRLPPARVPASPLGRGFPAFAAARGLPKLSPCDRVAPFHPGRQDGSREAALSSNPAYSPPETGIEPDKLHGSYHWDFERALSVALIPLVGASAAYGAHPITDLLLGVVLPLHSHIGFDACITDYVHGRKYPVLNKLCVWSLRCGTLVLLYGCYQFNTNDVGLTEGLKKIWKA